MRRLPEGYAVSGDAVSSFDPRFGQGMTVALVEAMELGRVLDEHGLEDVGSRFIAAAQWVAQDAWDLAAGSDLANVAVEGPRPLSWRMTNASMQRLVRAAHEDPVVAEAFVRVIRMVDRPAALMHPRILSRVLTQPRPRSRAGERVGA